MNRSCLYVRFVLRKAVNNVVAPRNAKLIKHIEITAGD